MDAEQRAAKIAEIRRLWADLPEWKQQALAEGMGRALEEQRWAVTVFGVDVPPED